MILAGARSAHHTQGDFDDIESAGEAAIAALAANERASITAG
jgi:hypothetical protein